MLTIPSQGASIKHRRTFPVHLLCSLLKVRTDQRMITALFSIDWLSTTGISSPLASITPNGWKNCAFIWITERKNVALHHPLVDRLARPKGPRSQDLKVRPRQNTQALASAQRSMMSRRHPSPRSRDHRPPLHYRSVARIVCPTKITCADSEQSVRLTR